MHIKTCWRYLILLPGLFLAACANEHPEQAAETAVAAESTTAPAPGGVPDLNSPDRKLIRTAGVHAEVRNLYEATAGIEAATRRLGGQITNSTLRKELLETRNQRAGDSVLRLRRYQGLAELSLRVPVVQLDTLLNLIAAQTVFIDTRQVHIDDATYRYLANTLHNRLPDGGNPDISKRGGLTARQYLDEQRGQSVDRQVQNLRMADEAAFATLSIELTQPEELVRTILPDLGRSMQPGAGQRFLLSLRNGWELLYDLFLALFSIWPLCLLTACGIWLARRWYRRQQQVSGGGMPASKS